MMKFDFLAKHIHDFVVCYAHPITDYTECGGVANYTVDKNHLRGCIYTMQESSDKKSIKLFPITRFVNFFESKVIPKEEFNKREFCYRLFDFPNEQFKSEGFRMYLNKTMQMIEKVKKEPDKYYLKRGSTIFTFSSFDWKNSKEEHWFASTTNIKSKFLIDFSYIEKKIFENAWEYNDDCFELKKYPLWKRIFGNV